MKRAFLLFITLMMTACSNGTNAPKGSTYRIDDPIYSVYKVKEDNKNFKASGLTDSDVVTKYKDAHVWRSHSPSFYSPRKQDGSLEYYVLDSYASMQEFDQSLNAAYEEKFGNTYSIKNLYADCFEKLSEADFANHNLILIREIELGSGSNGYTFKDLYLKDGTLYAYMMYSDYRNFPDRSATCDMVWIGLSFLVEKDVEYTTFKLLVDNYLPAQI